MVQVIKNMRPMLLAVLLILACLGQAANHYCIHDIDMHITMDPFHHGDETIVPEPFLTDSRPSIQRQCRWAINVDSSSADGHLQYIVLQGRPIKEPKSREASSSEASSRLNVSIQYNGAEIPLSSNMFCVYPCVRQFSVKSIWRSQQTQPEANLRILLPKPRACASDMLSFRGNCYVLSSVGMTAVDAMANIKGAAQLASFSSQDEIEAFVEANNARQNKFPYRRPLDLNQPVRVGLFYSRADSAVLSVARNASGCGLQEVPGLHKNGLSGTCGLLEVAKDASKGAIKFGNCSNEIPALLSFPETADSLGGPEDCMSSWLIQQTTDLQAQFPIISSTPAAVNSFVAFNSGASNYSQSQNSFRQKIPPKLQS